MPRTVLPSESCCFRLDSDYGYRQQFPMTFNDVVLSDDGFEFNGSNEYIDCGNDLKFNLTTDFSLEAKFKTGHPEQCAALIGKYIADVGKRCYALDIYKGKIRFILSSDGLDTRIISYPLIQNENYHVIATFDGYIMRLYLNNVEVTNIVYDIVVNTSDEVNLWIGRGIVGVFYYNGTIKHVSIYNRALTPQEISDRYQKSTFLLE